MTRVSSSLIKDTQFTRKKVYIVGQHFRYANDIYDMINIVVQLIDNSTN
jgi:hypothetical protein